MTGRDRSNDIHPTPRLFRSAGGAVTLLVSALLSWGCAGDSDPAQRETRSPTVAATTAPSSFGIDPLVSINQVMVALVDHAAHHLWDLGRSGAAPETDRDWTEVEHHAVQLAAGASWIATGGAGQADAGWVTQLPWKRYAAQLNEEAVAALEAARAKDLEGVLAAGDAIIEACEGCHREFKPDLPTEGVVHPHIYEPRVQ
jgi:hypothetical protein